MQSLGNSQKIVEKRHFCIVDRILRLDEGCYNGGALMCRDNLAEFFL